MTKDIDKDIRQNHFSKSVLKEVVSVDLGALMGKFMSIVCLIGIIGAFRYLDGKAKARNKFRKPKYKQFKID